MTTSLCEASAVTLLRPAAEPSVWHGPLAFVATVIVILLFLAITFTITSRREDAKETILHGGLTAKRREAIRAQGARAPAVALSADRVESDLEGDQQAMVIVAEVRPPGQAPYRVEIHAIVPCYPITVGSGPLIRVDTSFFVFVDHADPKTVVIDVAALLARENQSEADAAARSAEAAARSAREAAEKRERLLRGE